MEKLTIDLNASPSCWTAAPTLHAQHMGVVTREDGSMGALVKFSTGEYGQMNQNTVRALDKTAVEAALSEFRKGQNE